MLSAIIWILVGAIGASIIFFFVWRNNKTLIKDQAAKIDALIKKYTDKVIDK